MVSLPSTHLLVIRSYCESVSGQINTKHEGFKSEMERNLKCDGLQNDILYLRVTAYPYAAILLHDRITLN